MKNKKIIIMGLLGMFFSQSNYATELSGGLVKEDIKNATKKLAWGSAHRSWSAASDDRDLPLGMSLGIETTLIPRGKLLRMGDDAGVVPSVIPVPKFWMAWSLPLDLILSFDFAPGWIFDGITNYGSGLQWTFFRDEATLSVLAAYTYSNAFGDLKSHTLDAALQVSKTLELWQPYAGLGLINSYSKLSSQRIAPGNDRGYYDVLGLHAYLGFMAYLPAKVGFQFDLMNTQPSMAFLFAHEF